jgi:hypothetical protein
MSNRNLVNSGKDITPEHTKRNAGNEQHPDITAAYEYVEKVIDTSDSEGGPFYWYGWALREAFLAGISYAIKKLES